MTSSGTGSEEQGSGQTGRQEVRIHNPAHLAPPHPQGPLLTHQSSTTMSFDPTPGWAMTEAGG